MPERPFHYAWVIIAAGVVNLFACLGLGRFALGMLLPSMRQGLSLSYAELGLIGTGNFVGYLAGVVICGTLVRRLGARRVIFFGLLAVGSSMLLVSLMDHYLAILACYLVTGIGSGLANVAMMGLVAPWFAPRWRGRAAGLMVAGNGLGIMLSGTLIPLLAAQEGGVGWRHGWWWMGSLVLVSALLCGALLRNDPAALRLSPLGSRPTADYGPASLATATEAPLRWTLIAHLGAIYLLFGFTYVIYATFIVTTLVQELGYSQAAAGTLWVWVGFFSLFSGPVFGGLSDRLGRRWGMLLVFALQTGAYLLVGSRLTGGWIYLSIALFGLVVWSIPSILTAAVSDYLPRQKVTTALGQITLCFGLGQVCGPAVAGLLAETSGSFASSYLLAAALTATAMVLTLGLRPALPSPAAAPLG
ncbi:MAG: YbfB/YjiJ family MFS transporter [Desulfuromonadales bacterium]|nr:YbfB/YjiJ family MFS transporter [Desulfuromonadales bacterium]